MVVTGKSVILCCLLPSEVPFVLFCFVTRGFLFIDCLADVQLSSAHLVHRLNVSVVDICFLGELKITLTTLSDALWC